MLEITCNRCDYGMVESSVVTAQEYSKDYKFIYNERGELATSSFPDYIVFICQRCGNIKKISFLDILNDEKKIIMHLVTILRSENCSKTSRNTVVDEDDTIEYCGVCPGFCDGDGFCYSSAIKTCKFRRDILGS